MSIVARPKLTGRMLGDPSDVTKEIGTLLIGHVYGVAHKTRTRTIEDRDGSPTEYETIVGTFEGIPGRELKMKIEKNDVIVSRVTSNALYLPGEHHDALAGAVRADDANPVEFGISLYADWADTKLGYRWRVVPMLTSTAIGDPLASLRDRVNKTLADAVTVAAAASTPAPAGLVKGKGAKG